MPGNLEFFIVGQMSIVLDMDSPRGHGCVITAHNNIPESSIKVQCIR